MTKKIPVIKIESDANADWIKLADPEAAIQEIRISDAIAQGLEPGSDEWNRAMQQEPSSTPFVLQAKG